MLKIFPSDVVNQAVLELGLSVDPFPDLAKLVARCQMIQHDRDPFVQRGEPNKGPSKALIGQVADALGMQIDQA